MSTITGDLEEFTVTATWRVQAKSPEDARFIAEREGFYHATKINIKLSTGCKFCHHPKGMERHRKIGKAECRCSCNH